MRLAATAATAAFRASSPATAPGFLLAAAPKFTDAGEFETAREREDGRDGFEPLGLRERPAIHPVRLSWISPMNSMFFSAAATAATSSATPAVSTSDVGAALVAAAKLLLADFEHGRAIDVQALRAAKRACLLDRLFPSVAVTRHDAAHIHDHLDAAVYPSIVLMNPPFSVSGHIARRVADAAFRHLSSALARLAEGSRLVAITGVSFSPDNPLRCDAFGRTQELGRVVFLAAVHARVYPRHGTRVETRVSVIDKVPAET
jgi:predicted RNA methylase